ncbi:hypothetical protein F01_200042 [Burkholderia cenocepacia]|nr:hypothetical protein F01_200042 [Burkholderia cenocepacia]
MEERNEKCTKNWYMMAASKGGDSCRETHPFPLAITLQNLSMRRCDRDDMVPQVTSCEPGCGSSNHTKRKCVHCRKH